MTDFNDEWRIRNIDLYPDAEVRIFNRWGKMIFSSKNLSDNPWNGTIGGKPAPTDSYHYILVPERRLRTKIRCNKCNKMT